MENKQEIDRKKMQEDFILFIEAYDNYRLKIPELLYNAISMFVEAKGYDFDEAIESYK